MMNKKNKTKNIRDKKACISTKQGFTLIEVLIAMFIFVLIMTMVSASFSGFLKNYASSKKNHKSTETAQLVMNLMTKTIRTSSNVVINAGGAEIDLYDNFSKKCVVYAYDGAGKKMIYGSADPAIIDDPNSCNFAGIVASGLDSVLTSGSITRFSSFKITSPDAERVTILFEIQEPGQKETTSIESTVSIRNKSN